MIVSETNTLVRDEKEAMVAYREMFRQMTGDKKLEEQISREPFVHEVLRPPGETFSRGRETILFAEDEKEVRELLKTYLEGLGYKVLSAANGEEALQVFRTHKDDIDLVILDAVMPKLSGPKVYEKMRSISLSFSCLFVTGYSEEILQNYFDLGLHVPIIRKPITFQEFGQKVREILDQEN